MFKKFSWLVVLLILFNIGIGYCENEWVVPHLESLYKEIFGKDGEVWKNWKNGCESIGLEFRDLKYSSEVVSITDLKDSLGVILRLEVTVFAFEKNIKKKIIVSRLLSIRITKVSKEIVGSILYSEQKMVNGWNGEDVT